MLEVLAILVEAYEAEHWPVEAPDPVSAIEHVMEARGFREEDLALLLGSRSCASDVLNRRRPLTLPMIRVLAAEWDLPADVLIRPCDLAPESSAARDRGGGGRIDRHPRGHGA